MKRMGWYIKALVVLASLAATQRAHAVLMQGYVNDGTNTIIKTVLLDPVTGALQTSATGGGGGTGFTGVTIVAVSGGVVFPVSQSGNWSILNYTGNYIGVTVAAFTTSLPSGLNTLGGVTQSNGPWTSNLTQIGGSPITIGQNAMTASLPVVIASNQTSFPVKVQDSNGVSITLGSKVSASSFPVVIASDQGSYPVKLQDGSGNNLMANLMSDSNTSPSVNNILQVQNFGSNYNGTGWDRQRGNLDNITLVSNSLYTTTQTTADQTNYNGRGVIVELNISSLGAATTLTLEIDAKDPVSGQYIALVTSTAQASTGFSIYTVYPGVTATTNVSVSQILPRTWRVKVIPSNANASQYSVGASLNL